MLTQLAHASGAPMPPAAALLRERAALAGYRDQGRISPGGSCRLIEAADGWLAVNLARADDWSLLPAWLEADLVPEWPALADALRGRPCAEWLERGRLLGLAVAGDDEGGSVVPAQACETWAPETQGSPAPPRARRLPRVVDLSSLWAGPLCSHLLQRAGAEVIKLESVQRPDGARQGPPAFFDRLNAGKRSLALDFTTTAGRATLRAMLLRADIVIEAARPRALRQLGIQAEDLLRENPGLTWVAISGYGRREPQEQWIAYGDDAAVAAGLSRRLLAATGERRIVGDAIGDPLTGLHAAQAAWASWQQGGSRLLSLSLSGVVRQVLAGISDEALRSDWTQWQAGRVPAPVLRPAAGTAAALGADNAAVLAEWGIPC